MSIRLLVASAACLLAETAIAQTSTSARSFMLGPTIGIDQVAYPNIDGLVGGSSGVTSGGWAYGIEGNYRINKWLLSTKLLYRKRGYRQEPGFYELSANPFPSPLRYIDTDLRVLSMPISMGYRVTHESHFDWYFGASLAFEFLLSTSNQVLTDKEGSVLKIRPAGADQFGRSVNIGVGLQTTLRYLLTPRLTLQIEPAIRYYPSGGFPTRSYNTVQFQGLAAVLVNL